MSIMNLIVLFIALIGVNAVLAMDTSEEEAVCYEKILGSRVLTTPELIAAWSNETTGIELLSCILVEYKAVMGEEFDEDKVVAYCNYAVEDLDVPLAEIKELDENVRKCIKGPKLFNFQQRIHCIYDRVGEVHEKYYKE